MRNIHKIYDVGLNFIVFSSLDSPGCGVPKDSDEGQEIAIYLLAHPDALQPEPLPPPPSDAQLEAAAETRRQAEFAWQDTKVWVIQQERRRGEITQEECDAALAPLDAFAKALRAMNDEPGWFRNPQWPARPEA